MPTTLVPVRNGIDRFLLTNWLEPAPLGILLILQSFPNAVFRDCSFQINRLPGLRLKEKRDMSTSVTPSSPARPLQRCETVHIAQ